jgi:hypothetical protein
MKWRGRDDESPGICDDSSTFLFEMARSGTVEHVSSFFEADATRNVKWFADGD